MELSRSDLFQQQAYINGQFVDAHSKETFEVINPFSKEVIAQVSNCDAIDTSEAIARAKEALSGWQAMSATKRGKILKNWYQLQLTHAKDLAKLLTIEQGKPFLEALGEIKYGASYVEWFAEEARRMYGDFLPGSQSHKRIIVMKQAVGVVAAITPWNFPSAMITRKVAPALAAGCTVVIKPSELTPLSANALAVLAEEAGIPSGVFNIITTNKAPEVGQEMCSNKTVRKLSFTGSTAVGKILLKQCADTVKKVSLELGGNAPFIVFEDADLDKAVVGAVQSKFRNAGQTCICSNRLFVHEKVYDEFVEKFAEATKKLEIGNGLTKGVNVGPMIEEKAVASVEMLLEDATNQGAKIMTGGSRQGDASSLVFSPTVMTQVNKEMKVFGKEIFGPIAPVYKFSDEDEVIALSNDTNYGLAAYFYGKDHAKIWRVAEKLEYGMIGINATDIGTAIAPFGGIKESGIGREGSRYGMDEYLEKKYLSWDVS